MVLDEVERYAGRGEHGGPTVTKRVGGVALRVQTEMEDGDLDDGGNTVGGDEDARSDDEEVVAGMCGAEVVTKGDNPGLDLGYKAASSGEG